VVSPAMPAPTTTTRSTGRTTSLTPASMPVVQDFVGDQ
jgi:hypothetical protein